MNYTKTVDIPAGPFNKAKRLKVRVKIFKRMLDGKLYSAATGRSMSPETFETYKIASAISGIQIKII